MTPIGVIGFTTPPVPSRLQKMRSGPSETYGSTASGSLGTSGHLTV